MTFVNRDGYSLDSKVGTVLAGLQFPKDDWDRPCEEFSGGWQMRIALAKLLLDAPDLLLMDEPTNHLDIEARNWLEGYLNDYPHAYILISHDRYFLDVTVKKILEIWNKRVHFYPGNYDKYTLQKAERIAQITAAYANQRDKIEQVEAFITRFRYQATRPSRCKAGLKNWSGWRRWRRPHPKRRRSTFRSHRLKQAAASYPRCTDSPRVMARSTY